MGGWDNSPKACISERTLFNWKQRPCMLAFSSSLPPLLCEVSTRYSHMRDQPENVRCCYHSERRNTNTHPYQKCESQRLISSTTTNCRCLSYRLRILFSFVVLTFWNALCIVIVCGLGGSAASCRVYRIIYLGVIPTCPYS